MPSLSLHLLFLLFSISSSANSFHDDRHSLLTFKNDITSNPHASMADWTPAVTFCNWTAVKCSRHHIDRVVSLNLAGMDLAGSISPALGNLSFLRSLDLSNNTLHGHIPTQLGRLFRLTQLELYSNQLEGNIPTSLGNCTNLTLLALSYNNLTGSIPHELGSLKHLRQLYLGANILTGTSTLALRGSVGYIAPEYGLSEAVSTQGDVYSYGILLLEILTRKQPTSGMFVGDLTLHNWVNSTFPNRVKEVIDSGLLREVDGDEYEEENVYRCLVSFLRVGLLCSKHSPEERPTMNVVVAMLESIREDFVPNSITSRGVRRSISNLLSNSNAIGNDVPASNEHSSSTF